MYTYLALEKNSRKFNKNAKMTNSIFVMIPYRYTNDIPKCK